MKMFAQFTAGLALAAGCLHAADRPAAGADLESTAFAGKVVETTNAASYTYVLLDTGGKKLWAAAPRFEVRPGDAVEVTRAMAMPNYHSKTLNRDFDMVYFTGSVSVNGKPAGAAPPPAAELPQGHPPIGAASKPASGASVAQVPANHPPIGLAAGASKPTVDPKGIKKADGGKTVAEVVTGRAKLAGKSVAVRGRVVKYNDMVMGRNWLHIRDGSGSEGSNDLTVTTATPAKVGDLVLVKGKVATDRDFGAGYKYAVIIEDAQVTVE